MHVDIGRRHDYWEEITAQELAAAMYKSNEFDVLALPKENLIEVATEILYKLVSRQNLADKVSKSEIMCFVKCTSKHYGNTPFHNFYHAVSVMQAVVALVDECDLFTGEECFLLGLTALAHDAGHLGYTNKYLAQNFNIKCGEGCSGGHVESPLPAHQLVSKYGVLSPMEKHHVSVTLQILRQHKSLLRVILGGDLENEKKNQHIASMVLHVILCTDLALHEDLLHEMGSINDADDIDLKKMKAAALLMHAADLSNAARPFSMNYEWSIMLNDEKLFLEGPQNACTEIANLPKGEVFFVEAFVQPAWEKLRQVYSSDALQPWIDQIEQNRKEWEQMGETGSAVGSRRTFSIVSSIAENELDELDCECDRNNVITEEDAKCLKLKCTDSFIVKTPADQICSSLLMIM